MSKYHEMSLAEKERFQRDRMREPAMRCPTCETAVLPADMRSHRSRCPGRREPHPLATWITRREAVAAGLSERTLYRYARQGKIRTTRPRSRRMFLLRDVEFFAARKRPYICPRRKK